MHATQAIISSVHSSDWDERLEQARAIERQCRAELVDAQWQLNGATERYDQTNRKQARGEYTTAPYRLLLAVQEAQESRDRCSTALAMARGRAQAALGDAELNRWWQSTRRMVAA